MKKLLRSLTLLLLTLVSLPGWAATKDIGLVNKSSSYASSFLPIGVGASTKLISEGLTLYKSDIIGLSSGVKINSLTFYAYICAMESYHRYYNSVQVYIANTTETDAKNQFVGTDNQVKTGNMTLFASRGKYPNSLPTASSGYYFEDLVFECQDPNGFEYTGDNLVIYMVASVYDDNGNIVQDANGNNYAGGTPNFLSVTNDNESYRNSGSYYRGCEWSTRTTQDWQFPASTLLISNKMARVPALTIGYSQMATVSISGTVKNLSGNTISGATVSIEGANPITTDADGAYSFSNIELAGGDHTISVTAENYLTGSKTINISGAETFTGQDITLYSEPAPATNFAAYFERENKYGTISFDMPKGYLSGEAGQGTLGYTLTWEDNGVAQSESASGLAFSTDAETNTISVPVTISGPDGFYNFSLTLTNTILSDPDDPASDATVIPGSEQTINYYIGVKKLTIGTLGNSTDKTTTLNLPIPTNANNSQGMTVYPKTLLQNPTSGIAIPAKSMISAMTFYGYTTAGYDWTDMRIYLANLTENATVDHLRDGDEIDMDYFTEFAVFAPYNQSSALGSVTNNVALIEAVALEGKSFKYTGGDLVVYIDGKGGTGQNKMRFATASETDDNYKVQRSQYRYYFGSEWRDWKVPTDINVPVMYMEFMDGSEYPDYPEDPENLQMTITNAGLEDHSLSFKVPRRFTNGAAAEGDVTYTVSWIDAEETKQKTGTTTYGLKIQLVDDIDVSTAGEYTFSVTLTNTVEEEGVEVTYTSQPTEITKWIGPDSPSNPTGVDMEFDDDNDQVVLTWNPVTTSAHGGYFPTGSAGNITYKVIKDNAHLGNVDDEVLVESQSATSYTMDVTNRDKFKFRVQALINYGSGDDVTTTASDEVASNYKVLGDIVPDYHKAFDDDTDAVGWVCSTPTTHEGHFTWQYDGDNDWFFIYSSDSFSMDDYITSPSIDLQAGKAYRFKLEMGVSGTGTNKPTFNAYLRKNNNPSYMPEVFALGTQVTAWGQKKTSVVQVNEDGEYKLIIHATSPANSKNLYLNKFTVEEIPAVDILVTSAQTGEPIAGAKVTLTDDATVYETDANGKFLKTIDDAVLNKFYGESETLFDSQDFTIAVNHSYVDQPTEDDDAITRSYNTMSKNLTVTREKRYCSITYPLTYDVTVAGSVKYKSDGVEKALPDATVSITRKTAGGAEAPRREAAESEVVASTTTGADGKYAVTLPGVDTAQYDVNVSGTLPSGADTETSSTTIAPTTPGETINVAPILYYSIITSIESIFEDEEGLEFYTIDGRRVSGRVEGGVYIVKRPNGTTQKIIGK